MEIQSVLNEILVFLISNATFHSQYDLRQKKNHLHWHIQ